MTRNVLAALGVMSALSVPAAAALACAPGFQDAGGGVCTATFVYSGAPESVILPAGVGVVVATVSGAEGGTSLEEQVDPFGGAASPGGRGGRETATIPVAPGATLSVVVGQAGTGGMLAPPGYGGYGGGGHATSRNGGNGGGGSFVFDDNGPIIAAGGGGGGGYDYNPVARQRGDQQAPGGDGSGAMPAGDGQSVAFCCDTTFPPPQHNPPGGGGGATPTGAGLGGHPNLPPGYVFGQVDGDPGSGPALDANNFGNGGDTHNGCCYYTGWAGGGGGGYYGGGGGGNIEADLEGGGGGGGAGYVSPAAVTSSAQRGVQVGDGEVTLSYYTGACNVSCLTCSGPGATQCASCANGLTLVNGACVVQAQTPTATSTPTATPTDTPPAGTPTATHTASVTGSATPSATPTPTLLARCPAVPDAGCSAARNHLVLLRSPADPGTRMFLWKWSGGTAPLTQSGLGDPLNGGTGYSLCVYDERAGVPQLMMELSVAPNGLCAGLSCWKALGNRGWSYKNGAGNSDGVTQVQASGGPAGRSKIKLAGQGVSMPLPAPLSASRFFAQDPAVIVQLRSDSPSHCWTSTFTRAVNNGGVVFKAKSP